MAEIVKVNVQPVVLRRGQIWIYHNRALDEATEYVLEAYFEHFYGHFARLRNLERTEPDGEPRHALITQRWLYEGEHCIPSGWWELTGRTLDADEVMAF